MLDQITDPNNIGSIMRTRHGAYKEWYKSGRKKSLKHYKNGIENGLRKEWDENGTLTYEGNYVDGVEEIK